MQVMSNGGSMKLINLHITLMLFISVCFSKALFAGSENFSPRFVGCFPNGTCYIGIEPGSSTTICPNKAQIRFDVTKPGSDAQYSAALSALMANKLINVNITDVCIDGYPSPNWLHVMK